MTNRLITAYMTEDEKNAYGFAASLASAAEPDRSAWEAACDAIKSAEERAILAYTGPVKLNRFGQPYGGVHPALLGMGGYFSLNGCYEPSN